MSFLKTYRYLLLLLLLCVAFFAPAFVSGKVLLPADTIVGLYHPYRDLYASTNPNGLPYKNALITDPVRQQYPWKQLSIREEKSGIVPTWNPYAFSGTPLLATLQNGSYYPLNILFFVTEFYLGWNIYIVLQVLMGGLFMYLYLKHLKLKELPAVLGGFIFVYSGFAVAWLEWGNILHTGIWLPLIMLSIDNIMKLKIQNLKFKISGSRELLWPAVFVVSLCSSFFAGHLQTFFYLFLIAFTYLVVRMYQNKVRRSYVLPFAICYLLFACITSLQWYPTLNFLSESARSLDQADWMKPGWFIPWQHLVQFIAPDFFGNPATLNYFGVWNYAEFVGYIGILPITLSIYALFFRRDKHVYFLGACMLVAFLFALPTFLAMLPFTLSVPFLSTAQPTRLLFVIDFCLVMLAALGLDHLMQNRRDAWKVIAIPVILLGAIWVILLLSPQLLSVSSENISIAKRNLQLPTLLTIATVGLLLLFAKFANKKIQVALVTCMLVLTVVDLYRFHYKFTPFTSTDYLYPATTSITYLQQNIGQQRYMTLDSRILPPNFSVMYNLQSVDGYDPLYLTRYAELISASERGKPDITPPFGFNRIITPQRYDSRIIDLLGVKYILSLSDITSPKLKKVFQEGETRVYENTAAFPRAFFVSDVVSLGKEAKQHSIDFLFTEPDLRKKAVVEGNISNKQFASGSAEIVSYTPTHVTLSVETTGDAFLVLTDAYYPTWKAYVTTSGTPSIELPIYRTDYHFRGVIVPEGRHIVEFSNNH